MNNKIERRTAYFLMFITLLMPTLCGALSPEQQVANQVYQEFLSPFCPGRALADCPSAKATQLKEEILQEIQQGQSKDEVMRNLEVQFGAEYNAKPKFSGFAGLAWLIPVSFFLFLSFLGFLWIKRQVTGSSDKT